MNLGIWTTDLSNTNLQKLRKQGFNALFFPIGWFYDQSDDATDRTITLMINQYDYAKSIGFKYFLIDCSWGLGAIDNNAFYAKVMNAFEDCKDINFYFDEPVENLIETGKLTWNELKEQIENRNIYNNLFLGATNRNIQLLKNNTGLPVTVTSYFDAQTRWNILTPFVWIYGGFKIGGSLRYKTLSLYTKDSKINTAFLYQGDPDSFLKFLGLQNWFENFQRSRFIKYFS